MSTTGVPEKLIREVAPPIDNSLEIKDKLRLVFQLLWATLLSLSDIIIAAYRTVFPPELKSLKGQVVLVTGAGRGLGRGLALGFSREGCKIAVADINIDNALCTAKEICAAGGTAKAYLCNVASMNDVQALRQTVTSDLGPVDILVNNAGLIYGGDLLEDCPVSDIRAVLEVNLLSHFLTMKEFLPSMKARNSGHIVAIASGASFIGAETACAYVASKHGVKGLMECVHRELELRPNSNIYTTSVYPWFINTSADYVNRWNIRFPELSIDTTVDAIIVAVRRNQISAPIPSYMVLPVQIARFLPQPVLDRFAKLFFFGMKPLPKEGTAQASKQEL